MYTGFLKAAPMKKTVVRGGRRDLMATHEKDTRGRIMNPMIRMAHPKPNGLCSILASAIGNKIPPIEVPDTATPKLNPRFLSKYCDCGQGWELEKARNDAHQGTLCEHELPVPVAEAQHHQGKDIEDSRRPDDLVLSREQTGHSPTDGE